jgi:hypothetical protein
MLLSRVAARIIHHGRVSKAESTSPATSMTNALLFGASIFPRTKDEIQKLYWISRANHRKPFHAFLFHAVESQE